LRELGEREARKRARAGHQLGFRFRCACS
jgi:hypothetical protein